MAQVIDLEAERVKKEIAGGLACAHCGKPDSETRREHDLYCDDCLNNWLYADN